MATMYFCPECDSLMYPKEKRSETKLKYHCKNCGHSEYAGDRLCVFKHEIITTAADALDKVKEDVVTDPTLMRTKTAKCKECGHNEAVFFQAPPAPSDDRLRLIFVCTRCRYKQY